MICQPQRFDEYFTKIVVLLLELVKCNIITDIMFRAHVTEKASRFNVPCISICIPFMNS